MKENSLSYADIGDIMTKAFYQGFNEETITSCKMNECKHNKRGKCANDSMIVTKACSDEDYFETCDGCEEAEE